MNTKAISVVGGCILCALALVEHHSRVAAHSVFGNMTYFTGAPYFLKEATLANGQFHKRYEGGVSLSYYLHYDHQYVYGDFNQDGLRDAAVIITEGEGGSGTYRSLAFLINEGKQLAHQASHYLGDGVIVNTVRARNGKVILDMYVHQAHDCRAGPTKRVNKVYDYLNPDPHLIDGGYPPIGIQVGRVKEGLQDIYATSIPAQIRRSFPSQKRIIVFQVTPKHFGGVWALVTEEDDPQHVSSVWLYDRGHEEYEIRYREKFPQFFGEELIQQLWSPEYRQFWL